MEQNINVVSPRGANRFLNGTWSCVLLVLCLCQFSLLYYFAHKNAQPAFFIPARTTPAMDAPYAQDHPGPWGELEYVRVHIEPPGEFIPVDGRTFPATQWHFPNYTRERLTAFFNSCEGPPTLHAALINATWSKENANDLVVTPGEKLILDLPPSARQQIYIELSKSERNGFHHAPYMYPNGTFDEWLGDSNLPTNTLALLKRLTYQHGHAICFSDLPEIFAQTPDVSTQKRLVKALSRSATILMKLKVKPDTDVDKLVAYWAKGKHAKDIAPLLDSLTSVRGGMTIDVVQLLPPLARKLVNTYPLYVPNSSEHMPDCYWTAMNFFNDPPDDRYYDSETWQKTLANLYDNVTEPSFGDVILLSGADNIPFHAAVYIADDVVFTKNGGNYRQPWILMKIKDMLARYADDNTIHMTCFRAKPPQI